MYATDGVDLQTAFRRAMASVCTPVAVVTSLEDGAPHGTTVSAFASLSKDPPMLLVALDQRSALLAMVRRTGRFGLNVLGREQSELAINFSRKGSDKFEAVAWETEAGVPRLTGAAGFVACETAELVTGGDHVIILGTVVLVEHDGIAPLTYHGRVFGTHTALDVEVAS